MPGTMVLETVWDCGEGWLVVRDCLVMGPWRHKEPASDVYRRPPTDYDAEHTLVRTVRCTNGGVQVGIDCHPVFDYGRRRENWSYTERGYHQVCVQPPDLDVALTLTSDIRFGIEGPRAMARTRLREAEPRLCA